MKILLTGASGFLGRVIQSSLTDKDVKIISLGRNKTHIICDLTLDSLQLPDIDLVIHAAGKAHSVPKTEEERLDFAKVNVNGTINLLKSLEKALPKSFIFISSVSVYGLTKGDLVKESSQLNASDPYGLSKIRAEEAVQQWCKIHGVTWTIFRLPLIAGANPPGNLKTMITGIEKNYYFNVAGGIARKSMVLAEDVADIIPKAAQIGGIYNLTDGYNPCLAELSASIAKQLNKNKPYNIPGWLGIMLAKIGDLIGSKAPINSNKLLKITSSLTFDDSKARLELGWNPRSVLERFKIK